MTGLRMQSLKCYSTEALKYDGYSNTIGWFRKSKPAEIKMLKGDEYIQVRDNTPVSTLVDLKKQFPNGLKLALQFTKLALDKDGKIDDDMKKDFILSKCEGYTWETLSVDENNLQIAFQSNLKFKKLKIKSSSYQFFKINFNLISELLNKNEAILDKSNKDLLKEYCLYEKDIKFKAKLELFLRTLEDRQNVSLDLVYADQLHIIDSSNPLSRNKVKGNSKDRVTEILKKKSRDENDDSSLNTELVCFEELKNSLNVLIKKNKNILKSTFKSLSEEDLSRLEDEISTQLNLLKKNFENLELKFKNIKKYSDLLASYRDALCKTKEKAKIFKQFKIALEIKAKYEASSEYRELNEAIENTLDLPEKINDVSIKGKTFKKITKSYLECVEKIDTITQLSQEFEALLFKELSNSVLNENTRQYILSCDLLKKCTKVQIKYENFCVEYLTLLEELSKNGIDHLIDLFK